MLAEPDPVVAETGWHALLELEFAEACGRTVVSHRRHTGPLCLQKPFHPGDGSCHAYVLHPPGGLAGGDDLTLDVSVRAGASALITMPASTKFYRSSGARSRLANRLRVASGARLEWLPTETMLFGGSQAELRTEILLEPESVFIGWEALVLGRPLSGDCYATGRFEQRLEIFCAGAPLLLERTAAAAGDPLLAADWGLAGANIAASWFAYPADNALLTAIRAALPDESTLCHGATIVDGVLVLRVLGRRLEPVRQALETAWQVAAPALLGRPALPPRIWRT